jgi:hypothetical protein
MLSSGYKFPPTKNTFIHVESPSADTSDDRRFSVQRRWSDVWDGRASSGEGEAGGAATTTATTPEGTITPEEPVISRTYSSRQLNRGTPRTEQAPPMGFHLARRHTVFASEPIMVVPTAQGGGCEGGLFSFFF